MVYFSILVFFALTFFLGYSATSFVKNSENFLERNLMRMGIGIAGVAFLGLILNLLRIPIDWRIILLISLIFPIYNLIKNKPKFSMSAKITKETIYILVMMIIFFANLYVYATGAFAYPYLEDDDSWSHAIGVKYVSVEKTVFDKTKSIGYVDPYPPSYDVFLGIIAQTNNSIYFTLKFFNAFIVASSVIFFYFFFRKLSNSRNKALFAAFALFSLPAFLSHFIWAISLTVPLYFVAFYCLEMINKDKKWIFPASAVIATTLTASPTHSAYFVLLLGIYFVSKIVIDRKFPKHMAIAILLGASLSFSLWWGIMLIKYGIAGTLDGLGLSSSLIKEAGVSAAFRGTGDRIYNFDDFYTAKGANMVNNPIGIGKLPLVLTIVSFLISYFYLYSSNSKIKEKSKIKYWINLILIAASIIFMVVGVFYWKSSSALSPFSPEQMPQLEILLKNALPYIFIGGMLLIISFCMLISTMEENKKWLLLGLAWFLFTFYSVNASIYPLKISPFRAWMLLAIPIAMLSSEAALFIYSFAKSLSGKYPALILIALLLFGIYLTSLKQKIAVNTSPTWPAGGFWTSYEEISGYVWLKDNLAPNTKVFTFTNNGPIIGMDMYTCHWCQDVKDYQKNGFNMSADDNYNWLKKNSYRYITIDGQTAKKFGSNQTNTKLQEMMGSGKFKQSFGNNGMLLLKVI
ncbi:MAG: hypothetical protein AABX32_03770 [Nanoarchaeota archaeon]